MIAEGRRAVCAATCQRTGSICSVHSRCCHSSCHPSLPSLSAAAVDGAVHAGAAPAACCGRRGPRNLPGHLRLQGGCAAAQGPATMCAGVAA
jgi:hypothetical protein